MHRLLNWNRWICVIRMLVHRYLEGLLKHKHTFFALFRKTYTNHWDLINCANEHNIIGTIVRYSRIRGSVAGCLMLYTTHDGSMLSGEATIHDCATTNMLQQRQGQTHTIKVYTEDLALVHRMLYWIPSRQSGINVVLERRWWCVMVNISMSQFDCAMCTTYLIA